MNDIMLMGEDELLEEVDEYLLYCFYLGFHPEMRVRYRSPVREPGNADDNASWSLFHNTSRLSREYAWKDSGTGEFGDIFKLVMIVCRCRNRASALERVKRDFLMGKGVEFARQGVAPPKDVEPSRIRLKSKPFDWQDFEWWMQRTGANEQILNYFHVGRVKYYWMYDHQNTPTFPGDRVYSYRIYDHYQLYFPHREKDRRFRNDFSDDHLLGFKQLKYQSDTLIITKSMKDIITLYTLGFEAVSPRGENTPIPAKFIEFLQTKYKRIFTLFDNDGKHRAWSYPFPSIELPVNSQKDPSDHYLVFGPEQTKEVIDKLIKNHPMEDFSHLDLKKPRSRAELEELLEQIYLNKVIRIQHIGRKVREICGKIDRIAVETALSDEPMCIIMMHDHKYEFALPYFIQKAQVQEP